MLEGASTFPNEHFSTSMDAFKVSSFGKVKIWQKKLKYLLLFTENSWCSSAEYLFST